MGVTWGSRAAPSARMRERERREGGRRPYGYGGAPRCESEGGGRLKSLAALRCEWEGGGRRSYNGRRLPPAARSRKWARGWAPSQERSAPAAAACAPESREGRRTGVRGHGRP
eukprot:833790-Prymnesium_polylepis.1